MNSEKKYLDLDGLSHFKSKLDSEYVEQETGKGLSSNDYTNTEKTKLAGIDSGAEVNVIESITVNGVTATISGKSASVTIPTGDGAISQISVNGVPQTVTQGAVDISVPTDTDDLTNGAGFITGINSSDVTTALGYTPYNATNPSGYQTASQVETAINNKIGSAYKAKGSIAFANLPSLTSSNEGNVYNITDAFTTTSSFVEGAGKSYPAGTNVVIVNTSGSTYKYDVLSGLVDLSGYLLDSDLVAITNAEINALFS